MKINKLNIIVFEKLLKILLLAHLIILVKWKYYNYDIESFFKYPLIDFLSFKTPIIHHTIFGIFAISILLFCFNTKKIISLSLISLSFLYFIFSDLFLFHHDIFLATNITMLSALLIKFKDKETSNIIILAFKSLFTIVMFFAFFHKLNGDFHNGLLIKNMMSNNSLLAHFVNLKNSEFLNQISPIIAKSTILLEGIIPLLLWTQYRYIGAGIGCLFHFGICFLSGAGLMFNMYLPLLYLFFIPIKKVELIPNKFNKRMKLLDFYGGITLVDTQKIRTRKRQFISYFKFLPTNIFFLLLLGLYFLNTLRAIYNILFVQ